ncbi:MAG: RT0821/Lpp0805 family surface protein [Methyloceanibacter sp.]|uniref:RT0821/Lpp0805 family surface protein n=1 Tax=Methyloceanibacter sp. TaxID=1965321 RepID=UPI003D6D08A0
MLSVLLPAPLLKAEESGASEAAAVAAEPQPQDFKELKASLDHSDRRVALQALQMALTELADGVTLVWRRQESGLVGRIKPVSAFRDGEGRICRRLIYTLALEAYERKIEGVACREPDGSWSITG